METKNGLREKILVTHYIFQAFNIWGFSLPESVLDVLVGSTTVNVIALVGLVVKGLFPVKVSE